MNDYMDDDAERQIHAGMIVLCVFTKDGQSQVFSYVDSSTISYFIQEDVPYLRFRETYSRSVVIPQVAYWTEQDVA
jgi:hypothetical protein